MVIYLDCMLPYSSFARSAKRDIPEDAAGRCMVLCLSCSGWGLHSPSCYHEGGGLLHRHSTLTGKAGGFFSVALACGSPRPDVIRHPALWSPDFPHPCVRRFLRCTGATICAARTYPSIFYGCCKGENSKRVLKPGRNLNALVAAPVFLVRNGFDVIHRKILGKPTLL